ncbi:MAG: hypothetical protein GC168_10820 [Candidatus Hydrogenedens sp.]|nr:hypothetical protein [Candidatus Hydrogenedens sp.]
MKRTAAAANAALLLFLFTGCETLPWDRQDSSVPAVEAEPGALEPMPGYKASEPAPMVQPGLPLATNQRFPDVPLPVGVDEDFERTYVYETRDIKIGRLVYTSKHSVNELAEFYLRECPVADWRLVSSMQAEGIHMLFEKPGKRLEISVRGQGVGRSNLLVLNLTPMDS